ncbi:hypothetical protein EROM_050420 [Encephalitozoon romaleae SJ-2008]|uniref:Uncharacterized protein n=1 Tax=Encephalitozoon romaleae (strain SJ-2008) TaxID=1178016 RepID=I7AEA1_ENCRO|nr:hypothetical protein EROM_050420 [Encephalitozoon romaleae SJ-2008]AFN82975.1 hypothetical protein EROM_050420 [Encephalitozoon romaleae SJ-2008]
MCEIGKMNKEIANIIFQESGLGNVVSGEDKPVTGETYFSAVNTIFEILLDDEKYLKAVINFETKEYNSAHPQKESERVPGMESKTLEVMKQVLHSSKRLLFENPDGLFEIKRWNPNNVPVSMENFMDSISREVGKSILGDDCIPGFMILYKTGKYHDITSLIEEIPDSSAILGLKITVPIYARWGTLRNPTTNIATYVLLTIFCIRLKIESYVLHLYSSIWSYS